MMEQHSAHISCSYFGVWERGILNRGGFLFTLITFSFINMYIPAGPLQIANHFLSA